MASFLNKASQYGLYAVVGMATQPETLLTAAGIAETCDISQNHVAKILQQLSRAGLVQSTRGLGGGYQLARDPSTMTMLDVVECLDGPLSGQCGDCSLHATGRCREGHVACAVHNVLAELNQTAYFTLASVTIATLAREVTGAGGGLRLVSGQG